MYFSRELLGVCKERLFQLRDTERARREWLSGISRFLGCASLLHAEQTESISLRPTSPLRSEFAGQVGKVFRLDQDGQYTGDFSSIDLSQDYNISSHFLTTRLKESRGRNAVGNPGRPGPLLMLRDEEVSLYPDFAQNLRTRYNLTDVQNAFAIWLTRAIEIPNQDDELVVTVNAYLGQQYGPVVAAEFQLDLDGYRQLVAELPEGASPLSDERPEIASLFSGVITGNDEAGQTREPLIATDTVIGSNLIVYGAPGTGKSYKLNEDAHPDQTIITVFHPDMQNSDFFGCLKPSSIGGVTRYAFAPGPFARAIRSALASPEQHWVLIIEEINRAPAAAVFGELFQLLDRDPQGQSSYEIDFPTPESREWFSAEGFPLEKLYIPSNLSLRASMNSADQGVYPLDTAFRRRWEQDYMPFDYNSGPEGILEVCIGDNNTKAVPWRTFARTLNDRLSSQNHLQIPEDRLLGQWFLKSHELGGQIPNKILLYLWDDLLRHEGRETVFDYPRLRNFADISRAMKAKEKILSSEFLAALCDFDNDAMADPNASHPAV